VADSRPRNSTSAQIYKALLREEHVVAVKRVRMEDVTHETMRRFKALMVVMARARVTHYNPNTNAGARPKMVANGRHGARTRGKGSGGRGQHALPC